MMNESRASATGTVRGDTKPMTDNGASRTGEYDKSLGEASRSDLGMEGGFHGRKSIAGDTKSDDKGFA